MSEPSQQPPHSASSLEEIRAARLEKVEQMKALGLTPYAYQWQVTHHAADLQKKYATLQNGEEVDLEVSLAGRIVARRVFGKLAFFSLQDETGTIQLYLEKQRIGEQMSDTPTAFNNLLKLTDVGDILGVSGTIKQIGRAHV